MENSKFTKGYKILTAVIALIIGIALVTCGSVFHETLGKPLEYTLNVFGAIFSFVSLVLFYFAFKTGDNKLTVKQMTLIAVQSAISVILYYFVKFNVPFFPPWLDIQVSEIPALITAFAYGPYAGSLVIFIRFVTKLPATITAGVGEVADLVLGVTLVCISSLMYRKNKTIKSALIGTVTGTLVCTVLACVLNWLVLIPAYIHLAGFSIEMLSGMMSYIPWFEVTPENFMLAYIFIGVLPFNLFRYVIVAIITFILYKKTHIVLNRLSK